MQTVCSPGCALSIVNDKKEKEEAARLKRERQEWRAKVAEAKPRQYWLKRAENAVNAYIRERDREQPCISCGTWDTPEWHAGHFIPVGRSSSIRYDFANIHRQCHQCNWKMGGNQTQYEERLPAKIGLEEVERLKVAPRLKAWTREECQAIEADAKARLRELMKVTG